MTVPKYRLTTTKILAPRCTSITLALLLLTPALALGQDQRTPAPPQAGTVLSPAKAMVLAEQGRCKEALPALKKMLSAAGSSAPSSTAKDEKKKAGVLGVRCAMAMDDRAAAGELLSQLSKQFPNDPEVMYVLVHAYSDLSSRAAADLGMRAPQSVEARKLNAEALEVQGKWDDAAKQYHEILAQNPNQPGIHYLLGRIYLSKPDPDEARISAAKQEFVKELEIDPKNAGAEYVLGEMARQGSDWEEAIRRFSAAAKLDASFGDAFWGWGFSLVSAKRYEEAVAPLQTAVRLEPGNPSAHYNLAMALSRTGHKEEADREFAIQRQLVEKMDAERNAQIQTAKPN